MKESEYKFDEWEDSKSGWEYSWDVTVWRNCDSMEVQDMWSNMGEGGGKGGTRRLYKDHHYPILQEQREL